MSLYMDQRRTHHHVLGVKENTLRTNSESDSTRVNPQLGLVRTLQQLLQRQWEAVEVTNPSAHPENRINPNSFKGATFYFSTDTHSSRCIYSTDYVPFPDCPGRIKVDYI